jgi:hypothetical protein
MIADAAALGLQLGNNLDQQWIRGGHRRKRGLGSRPAAGSIPAPCIEEAMGRTGLPERRLDILD